MSGLMFRALRLSAQVFVLTSVVLSLQGHLLAADTQEPKKILILYSFDREEGIYIPLDAALRSTLKSELPGGVQFYTEYLDLVRFPDSKHRETLAHLLALKFAGTRPDVIIPVSYSALSFLLDSGMDIFPGVPIVALFNERRLAAVTNAVQKLGSRVDLTAVEGRDDPRGTLDLALNLQPDTKTVALIVGSSSDERFWLQQLQTDLEAYDDRVSFTYLHDLPMGELLKQVAALPPHTILFYSFFFEDSTGQSFLPEEALDRITSSAAAPVYGMYMTYVDHGIIGGRVSDSQQSGAMLAKLAARVLRGEKASTIPFVVNSSLRDVVDWRQLRRRGIGERRVPPGTLLLYRELSPWQRYRVYILIAFLLLLVQALLIVGLWLQTKKRHRAERRLLKQKAFSDALIEALPGYLLVQNPDSKNVRWNKNVERDMRFHPKSVNALGNVSESSRDLAKQATREVFEKGHTEAELEVMVKGGRTIPTHFHAVKMELEGKPYLVAAGIDVSERKRMEEELRLSEERFSSAFEHAPIGIALLAPDGGFIKANEALCRILGYSADELQTKSYADVTHPEDVDVSNQSLGAILAGAQENPLNREKRYVHRSGRVVWASLSTSLVRDNRGQPLYFICQVQDITDRKKIEDSIRTIVEGVRLESSAGFFNSMALQLSKATGAEHTIIGELMSGAEPAIRSLGLCLNRSVVDNITYKLAGTPCDAVTIKGVCSYSSEVAKIFPDDHMLREMGIQAYAGVPLVDSRNRTIGIMAAMFNSPLDNPGFVEAVLQVFSKWTAAEIERGQAEERFSKAFQSSPEGFAIATLSDGRIIEANDAFFQMIGYQRSEVIDRTVGDLGVWADPQERVAIIQKILATGKVREEAVRFKTKAGRILQVRFSGEVIQLQNELCLLGLARDVTEQNVLEEKFRQSQKMEAVGMLAGGVAHDFNNLLGVIIGYSEMLSTSAAPNSPTLKKIDSIKQAAHRAAMLTTQLLAYSRKQSLQPRLSNLNSIVSETEKMLRRLIGENIRLTIIVEPNLGFVNVDPGQMVQVLMNLVINARDAMSRNGTLTIQTANVSIDRGAVGSIQPGQYVKLAVSDTGTGMDEATKSRIFEPFFTTKAPGQGTGLGLATVQGIVEQSGGSISVETKLGVGTKFEIYLPQAHAAAPAPESEISAPKPASGSATILLVEDEVAMRMVIDEGLRSEGYRVLAVGNGLDAIRVAEQYQGTIDLLVSDVIMPAMSGPELAQVLLTSRPGTPVLYISGYTADKLTHYPELEQDIALLQKPFKLHVLLQKVRDLIGSLQTEPS